MATFRSSRDVRDRPGTGLAETLRLLRLEQRKPTEHDRPPASVFPGRKHKVIPGQLGLGLEEKR
jgi:hypothetical protein